ncbi:MFS general substrate transporter [Penicillium argentinense]|uniref:MFS general substrate transporter n=1 Tax=Penicillium argentinense TaxID=1131581 RepID=A0A9W9EPI6_9EURO|nr:MFS general substrate transporter [Penicillium argentinense]KAJ5085549.1 MFS general substrate transporter [Penicillium argentinense]
MLSVDQGHQHDSESQRLTPQIQESDHDSETSYSEGGRPGRFYASSSIKESEAGFSTSTSSTRVSLLQERHNECCPIINGIQKGLRNVIRLRPKRLHPINVVLPLECIGLRWTDTRCTRFPILAGPLRPTDPNDRRMCRLSRRRIVYTANLASTINARRGIFLIGEVIQGASLGTLAAAAQTYISETIPTSLRGSVMALYPTFILLGQLVSAAACFASSDGDASSSYLVTFISMWPFSVVSLIFIVLVPGALLFFCGAESLARETAESSKVSYRDCFQRSDLRRTLIVSFVSRMPTLFDFSLLSDASYFLPIVGMDDKSSLMMFVLGAPDAHIELVVCDLASFAGNEYFWLFVEHCAHLVYGRHDDVHRHNLRSRRLARVILSSGRNILSATEGQTQGISTIVADIASIVFGFVLPYVYNKDATNLDAKTGFLFFAICASTVTVTWWAVPEMMGRSSMEIDHMFKLGLPARKFHDWRERDGMDDMVGMIGHGH